MESDLIQLNIESIQISAKLARHFNCEQNNGEVSERPMEHAWKVCKQKCFQGSNPCLTAINKKPDFSRVFYLLC